MPSPGIALNCGTRGESERLDETLKRIQASAKLEFRPVLTSQQLTPGQPSNTFMGQDGKSTPYPTPDPGLESTPTAKPTNASDLNYVTPALYFVREIPPNLLVYLRWNPLYPSFAALEQIFNAKMPSPVYLLAASAWALGFFLFGAVVFLARERDFAVRL